MKKKLMLLLLAFGFWITVSCQDREAIATLEDYKAQAEIEERNIDLAKRYFEACNRGDFDALRELLSPDYVVYSPSGYPEPASREKYIESMAGTRKAFLEFNWSLEDVIAAKDKVVCRMIAEGTFAGGIAGIPGAGKEVKISMITIMRMADGKVVEEWQEDDQLGLARQLGMELKPKEGEKN